MTDFEKVSNETAPIDVIDDISDKVNAFIDDVTTVEKKDNIVAKTAAYTLVKAQDHMITVSLSADATFPLPAASTCSGYIFEIKLINEGYVLTIDAGAGIYIDENLRYIYMTQIYSFARLKSDGTNWHIIGPR
jgi:hypothetical protein